MFSVIGDANVVDHMTSFNMASREVMKRTEVIPCPSLEKVNEAFLSIRFGDFYLWRDLLCSDFWLVFYNGSEIRFQTLIVSEFSLASGL